MDLAVFFFDIDGFTSKLSQGSLMDWESRLYQDRKIHFFKKIETGSRAFITYFFHFFTSHITVHFCGLTGIIPLMHLRTVLTPTAA